MVTGVPWTNMNNGNYYQEINGQEWQGVFYNYKTNVTNVSCNGGADGAVDLTVTGGRAPYTYEWSTNATSQD
ncbi:MAG: SprB repeat-containing protein, partial [Flavobacterium sp.]